MIDQYLIDKILKYRKPNRVYFLEIEYNNGYKDHSCFLTEEEMYSYFRDWIDRHFQRFSQRIEIDKIYLNDSNINYGREITKGQDILDWFNENGNHGYVSLHILPKIMNPPNFRDRDSYLGLLFEVLEINPKINR